MSRPARIGLIAYEYPPLVGGMATYAQALAAHMCERGYEVHVFSNRDATTVGGSPEVHPILTTDLARDLPRLSRYRMDLWHSINFGYAPLAAIRRPFVLTVHGTDFLNPWVRFSMDRVPMLWRASGVANSIFVRRRLYGAALRCVDQVLTCSRFSADLFRQEYPSAASIQVVPNGVEGRFLALCPGAIARHPRRLLTVCNLDVANRRKNVDGVIRAVAMLRDEIELQYWVVGDGPERPALEQLARGLGVADRVRFLGRVGADVLLGAYQSSSLFVLVPRPITCDVEGFGIVYLEAAAAGTPSLAGRHGGAEDAVVDGVTGFFASGHSPDDIAAALRRFFRGAVRIESEDARAHAARHAWPMVLKRVERGYEHLLPAHLRPSPAAPMAVAGARIASHRRDLKTRSWSDWVRSTPQITSSAGSGRVLLVSYEFPPTGGSGVQRAAKLARYLPDYGWSVEVLTAAHSRFPWHDASLLADVPTDCVVHRVSGLEPACIASRIASIVPGQRRAWFDDRIYWWLARLTARLGAGRGESLWSGAAVAHAAARHQVAPFDAVISTGPPHFVHRVGMRIARTLGVPWLADVRDPLVSDFERNGVPDAKARMMRRLEQAILRRASVVVTTCDSLARDLRGRYPERPAEGIVAITNGFDREDVRRALGVTRQTEACVFSAAGAFYGRRELAYLVDPLKQLLERRPEWKSRVRMVVAGTLDAAQARRWRDDCPDWLTLAGYLRHEEAIGLIAASACSIVVVPECGHGRLSVPGKLFELLALPAHVLALVPPGSDADTIVRQAGGATSVPFEDVRQVSVVMERIVDDFFASGLDSPRDWDFVDSVDRRAVAAAFARCLNARRGGVSVHAPSTGIGEMHLVRAEEVA